MTGQWTARTREPENCTRGTVDYLFFISSGWIMFYIWWLTDGFREIVGNRLKVGTRRSKMQTVKRWKLTVFTFSMVELVGTYKVDDFD